MSSDTLQRGPRHAQSRPIRRTANALTDAVRSVAFWLAVLLPLVYLPMIAFGLVADHPSWFVALLGTNALALVLGHAHETPG